MLKLVGTILTSTSFGLFSAGSFIIAGTLLDSLKIFLDYTDSRRQSDVTRIAVDLEDLLFSHLFHFEI